MRIGLLRSGAHLLGRKTAQRMVNHNERVVRDIELPCHVFGRGDEWLCTNHQRGPAMLFKRDAVVQTAQRATPSVTIRCDEQIYLGCQLLQLLGLGKLARMGLTRHGRDGALMMLSKTTRGFL